MHFSSSPLQTGASLFTFAHSSDPVPSSRIPCFPRSTLPTWTYLKSEDPALVTPEGAWAEGVDYVVTDDWAAYEGWKGVNGDQGKGWEVVGEVEGLVGFSRGGKWGAEIRWGRRIGIVGRKGSSGINFTA